MVGVDTLNEIKPFSSLLDWDEAIKHSWDRAERLAPITHAELLTLEQLAKQTKDIDVETMIENLTAKGIKVESSDSIIGEVVKTHKISPIELYVIATGAEIRIGGRGHGGPGGGGQERLSQGKASGLCRVGQMTLEQYCTHTGLDLDKSVEKLRETGLQATAQMTIRGIADSRGLHPSEIRGLLE
jgi:hypothetical protein